MSTVSLKIYILGKEYQVNCQPEEREALERSAELLNEKWKKFVTARKLLASEELRLWRH